MAAQRGNYKNNWGLGWSGGNEPKRPGTGDWPRKEVRMWQDGRPLANGEWAYRKLCRHSCKTKNFWASPQLFVTELDGINTRYGSAWDGIGLLAGMHPPEATVAQGAPRRGDGLKGCATWSPAGSSCGANLAIYSRGPIETIQVDAARSGTNVHGSMVKIFSDSELRVCSSVVFDGWSRVWCE
jgi:hypothetical protein